ncbi:MAG: hypothetical protein ACRDV9_06225 [Acidimicrobiia bacterium]
MASQSLACAGHLVATAEVADPYGYDSDHYDHIFLFKNASGYELLVVSRRERYEETGELDRAATHVDVTPAPSGEALGDLVEARWSCTSAAWWQILDRARENDAGLHAPWVPERMLRDLDSSSVYDKGLALRSGYFGVRELGAPGRDDAGWKERAVGDAAALLADRGWQVRTGPAPSPEVEPGGLSVGSQVLGSLWASRYGREVALVIRVDDCGEIYPRLADPEDLRDPWSASPHVSLTSGAVNTERP